MHDIIPALKGGLARQANADKAAWLANYMKMTQPFYGVYAPERAVIAARALKQHPITTPADYEQVVLQLWNGRYREEQYLAVLIAELAKSFNNLDALPLFIQLTNESTWWDTVDWIAIGLLGNLLQQHPRLESTVRDFGFHPNLWTRRAALIAQNKLKGETNRCLLEDMVLTLAHENEFFIQKAIGWALREFSKSEPAWVTAFVSVNEDKLSALSKREALKAIRRKKLVADRQKVLA